MALDLFPAGQVMAVVKGAAGSPIASAINLGLSEGPVSWQPIYRRLDVIINAFGDQPAEIQQMGLMAMVSLNLTYFDQAVIDALIAESAAGSYPAGTNPYAGKRMGNGSALYASDNHFFSVGLSSPVAGKPYTFLACHLTDNPITWPVGAERSVVQVNFRAISYSPTPTTSAGVVCWNNNLLSAA